METAHLVKLRITSKPSLEWLVSETFAKEVQRELKEVTTKVKARFSVQNAGNRRAVA
jgi:hypothetical protein